MDKAEEERSIRGAASLAQLAHWRHTTAIRAYVREHNKHPRPFIWTATAEGGDVDAFARDRGLPGVDEEEGGAPGAPTLPEPCSMRVPDCGGTECARDVDTSSTETLRYDAPNRDGPRKNRVAADRDARPPKQWSRRRLGLSLLLRLGPLLSHPYSRRLNHDQASRQRVQVRYADEVLDKQIDRQGSEAPRPKEDHTGMTAGRVLPEVAELQIESEKHTVFSFGGSGHLDVGP